MLRAYPVNRNMKPYRVILLAFLLVGVLLGYAVCFTVEEGRVAMVKVFGRADGKSYPPGLHFVWPWPIGQVVRYDVKAHLYEGVEEQVLTRDQYSFRIRAYVLWRIHPDDVIRFYESAREEPGFERQIAYRLRSTQNSQFGRHRLAEIFSTTDQDAGLNRMQENMVRELAIGCRKEYGVEIISAGFTTVGLTDAVLEDVYAKMSSERRKHSERLKAEGESEAKRIRAEAQAHYDTVIAGARGQAKEMLGQAEAESIEAYRTLARDPGLSLHLKKQDTLEKLLKDRATIILDPSVPPLDILRSTPTE